MQERLQEVAMRLADGIMACIPRAVPGEDALRKCKIISHRGEYDKQSMRENTLPAFERARVAGVWGIECDIRWTADLVPVICHDPDCRRVFGDPTVLAQTRFDQLRARLPQVPSLEELVAQFGGVMHLMLEIKDEAFPDAARQRDILREILSGLQPGRDYHCLALDPALFRLVDFAPRHCCLPVAETNVGTLSRAALAQDYGGLMGHFLLLGKGLQQRHVAAGQRIGTGFIASRYCLWRELNRGIEWIFSNDAVKIQGIVNRYL